LDLSRRVGIAIGIVVLIGWPLYQVRRYNILDMASAESIYPEAVHWAERRLPGNAIVISSLSGAFFFYADRFSARADQLNDDIFRQLRPAAARRNLRWYAVLSDGEPQFHNLEKLLPGRWTLVGAYRNVAMWRLDS
jgi:hypothetical protein